MPTAAWTLAATAAAGAGGVLAPGTASSFVALLLFAAVVFLSIQQARHGTSRRTIRPLPALDALNESIGRATEMGRPVLFIPGIGGVTDPQTISSYPILARTALACARYDTRLLQPNINPVVYAVNDAIVRETYLEAGRPDAYNRDDVHFITANQFGFLGGVWQLMESERPAAAIYYGDFAAECLLLFEMGALIDSVQIGATANAIQIPFFVAQCDYALIADEMYAASAYISREPVATGTVIGEDLYKFLILGVIALGVVWASIVGGPAGFAYLLHR